MDQKIEEDIDVLFTQLQLHRDRLKKAVEESAEECGMSVEEFDAYSMDADNFSPEDWTALERDRRKLMDLHAELQKILSVESILSPSLQEKKNTPSPDQQKREEEETKEFSITSRELSEQERKKNPQSRSAWKKRWIRS